MAASTTMQSMFSSPTLNTRFAPSVKYVVSCIPNRGNFRIRSMSEGEEKDISSSSGLDANKATQVPINSTTPIPSPIKQAKTKNTGFKDIFAFSGPGPERINGRLAMIGFVTAIGVELANGQDIFSQVANGGVTVFLGTSVLLTLASLVPLLKGVSVESKSNGLMTSDAEIWNGRFAMLGLVGLAFTEFVKGSALI